MPNALKQMQESYIKEIQELKKRNRLLETKVQAAETKDAIRGSGAGLGLARNSGNSIVEFLPRSRSDAMPPINHSRNTSVVHAHGISAMEV